MSTEHLIPSDLLNGYHVKEWLNATGILATACAKEWAEVIEVLRNFRLLKSECGSVVATGSLISPKD